MPSDLLRDVAPFNNQYITVKRGNVSGISN